MNQLLVYHLSVGYPILGHTNTEIRSKRRFTHINT